MQAVLQWMVKGRQKDELASLELIPDALKVIWGFERLKELASTAGDKAALQEAVRIIGDLRMPHEAVPNEFKANPEVWDALLSSMKPEAMLRNLNKMTAVGLLTNMSAATKRVVDAFSDAEKLRKARLHPMRVLVGLKTYAGGHGIKGSLTWSPVPKVIDALDKAFYLAFKAVEPTGKRYVLALDVSGSMGSAVSGQESLSCREAVAALALTIMNVEQQWEVIGFTSGSSAGRYGGYGRGGEVSRLKLSPRQRLDDACNYMAGLDFGGTDCALPMTWAKQNKVAADVFVVLTDNATWAGSIQPVQALQQYRKAMGIPAKVVVVGMTATEFSIADPADAGMMDCVGFDAGLPEVIADFVVH